MLYPSAKLNSNFLSWDIIMMTVYISRELSSCPSLASIDIITLYVDFTSKNQHVINGATKKCLLKKKVYIFKTFKIHIL